MQASQRIRELFDAAVDLPKPERIPYLLKACAGDDQLFAEVARLVTAYEETAEEEADRDAPTGAVLGAYQIVRELGQGGMGAVYLARRIDGAFERQVAVKVIRADRRTRGALERFARERRLLASLTHPGISRLLDAGAAPDGQPYFVMEYVDGLPITKYCDRRCLPVADRVRLFLEVCEAVASAHRVPIVHCDLKPRNILVDAQGQPFVLDFGIAKALTPGGQEADTPLDPYGSPHYASPEQMRGEPLHTTSDIYSLGVVLFELLVGVVPQPSEVDRPGVRPGSVLRDGGETTALSPQRPEAVAALRGTDAGGLRRSLAGDLDAIVAKCLAWRPELRYQSVDALADDLRRYLDARPVSAREHTPAYLAGRFAVRHRSAVAAAALTALLLAAAAVWILVLWQRAESARVDAERRFADLRSLATSLFDVDAALSRVPGSTAVRQQVIGSATAALERLGSRAAVDPGLAMDLAEGHRRVGDMLGNPNVPNLGARAEALEQYDAAARTLAEAGESDSERVRDLTARIDTSRGDVLLMLQRHEEARAAYQRAADLLERLSREAPDRAEYRRALSGVYRPLGDLHVEEGDARQGLALYQKARAIDLDLLADHPGAEATRQLALTELRVADAAARLDRPREAIEGYRHGIDLLGRAVERGLNRGDVLRETALARLRLSRLIPRPDASARADLQQALAALRDLAARDPHDAGAQRDLMVGLVAYADALGDRSPDEARRLALEARAIGERLSAHPVRDDRAMQDLEAVLARVDRAPTAAREVRIAILREGREVPIDVGTTRAPAIGEALRVSWPADAARRQYVLMLGGAGPATLHDRRQLDQEGWRVRTTGPLPSQTVLVLEFERALSDADRAALLERVARISGPRTVDPNAHIVWPSGRLKPLDASFRFRGQPPEWVEALRAALDATPGVTYSGRSFPLDGFR